MLKRKIALAMAGFMAVSAFPGTIRDRMEAN